MNQPKLYDIQHTDFHTDKLAFRSLQHEVLKEQQHFGNKWLISDFITLGSPLAHAQILMARSKEDLNSRIIDRELPTCPPVAEKEGLFTYQDYRERKKVKPWYLHHAAPFACTRWTNFYYPGDIVGGPISPVFGEGILDKEITFTKGNWLRERLVTSHTKYWIDKVKAEKISKAKEFDALKEIYRMLQPEINI